MSGGLGTPENENGQWGVTQQRDTPRTQDLFTTRKLQRNSVLVLKVQRIVMHLSKYDEFFISYVHKIVT